MNPRDRRAKANELKAEALKIYDAHKADDAPEMSDDEAKRYDACLDEAEKLVSLAAAEEAREQRMNDLDARLKTEGRGDGDGRANGNAPHTDERNTRGKHHSYSLLKALRQSDPKSKNESLDGLELEVHQELARGRSRAPQGVLVPWDLPIDLDAAAAYRDRIGMERRDLTTTGGAGAVFTVVSTTMIEYLRNNMLARRLGARVMSGMQGNFTIPRQTGTGTAYWVTEGNAPTESSQTIGALSFSPSTLGAFSDYSRAFLHQTSVDAEQFVREDLAMIQAIELDRVAFNGSGVSAEPEGIIPNSSVNVVVMGTNGLALTWAKIVEMESTIDVQNALNGSLAFVTNPVVRGSMKGITRIASSTFPDFLWKDDNSTNGYPAYASNQIPKNLTKGTSSGVCAAAIFGDFTQIIYALWGGLDTLVDPYTGGTAGNVRIITLQDADFQVRQPKAFSVIKDILYP
jgi:HK97 family phage major capsid protein